MAHTIRKWPAYGNHLIRHPDGTPMFRCGPKKLRFYRTRDLVELLDDGSYRLRFTPNGPGNAEDPYLLAYKDCRCVVCGSIKKLTRHHVVPYCYRRHLPYSYKSRCHHDVLILCWSCHEDYELPAAARKGALGAPLGAPVHGAGLKVNTLLKRAGSYANAIIRYGHQMPADKYEALWVYIDWYLGRPAEVWDLPALLEADPVDASGLINHGKIVVDSLSPEAVQGFVDSWRDHFLETMHPRFLPAGWDPRRPVLTPWSPPEPDRGQD